MKGSAALAEMQEAMKDTEKGLPKDGDKLWDHLLKQDQKRLLEILAVCVASTVDTVHCVNRSTVYHADETAVAQLTAALKLDMTDYWEATAASYFDRVSSAQIIAAVTEACGKAEAAKLTGMKKAAMAKAAVKGKGWLPAILKGGKGA